MKLHGEVFYNGVDCSAKKCAPPRQWDACLGLTYQNVKLVFLCLQSLDSNFRLILGRFSNIQGRTKRQGIRLSLSMAQTNPGVGSYAIFSGAKRFIELLVNVVNTLS